DASGYYTFTALTPNQTYTVTFFPPSGYTLTGADNGSDASDSDPGPSGVVVVPMGSTDNYTIDAGLVPLVAQFGDRVWIESDTDGLASTGVITPVAGMLIIATNGSNIYATTTNAQGYYSFTVPAGSYTVLYGGVPSSYGNVVPSSTPGGNSESGSEGVYQEGGNPDQSHQNSTTVTVELGEANWTIDFAFNLAGTPTPVNLGNYVWFDQDGDGQQDASEPGAGGVTVTLTLPNGNVLTTTTDASGYYTFTALTPNQTYTVTFFPPEGYTLTDADNGSDASDSDPGASGVVVVPMGSTDNYTIDAGLVLPAQFGDRVWIESDTDGLASTGVITPVAGMVITATSGSSVYTTTTNAQGYYSFTVLAGTYTVTYGSVPSSYGNVVPSGTPGGNSESGNEVIHQ
ncbi:MAG: SdrD B-like domain-containing protein, partial [Caldilinea sp.]